MLNYKTSDYASRLEEALEIQNEVKEDIAFFKLQIKQEKQQAKWAAGSPVIKQFKACWPDVKIDHGAGLTYLSLNFGPGDDYEAHIPGWELLETQLNTSDPSAPLVRVYRIPGVPARLYVTKRMY